jgi:uncharacterized protein
MRANGRPGKVATLEAVDSGQQRIRSLKIFSLIIIGFAISMLSGLLGIGGGSILVPAMVFLLGMSQHRANATSLAVIAVVAVSGAVFYSRHGLVNWYVAVELMFGGVIGAAIGAKLCNRLSAKHLKNYFGIFLALIGLRMLYGAVYAAGAGPHVMGRTVEAHTLGGGLFVMAVGVVTGVLAGLFGIGGGLVMVPVLTLMLGFAQKSAQGISLAVMIPVAVSGTFIHSAHGNVRWGIALWLAVGGILGSVVGARLAVTANDSILRGLFGTLVFVTGILMFRHKARCAD